MLLGLSQPLRLIRARGLQKYHSRATRAVCE